MKYDVYLLDRDGNTIIQPGLKFAVESLSWTDWGGAQTAKIEVINGEDLFLDLANKLGYEVNVVNKLGEVIWSGFINTVNMSRAHYRMAIDLGEVANRVAVSYTESSLAGQQSGEIFMTPWADDLYSQGIYGIKEEIIQRENSETISAEKLRDVFLMWHKQPQMQSDILTSQETKVWLDCLGWIETLFWRYYSDLSGFRGNTPQQEGVQAFGNTTATTRVGFSFTTIKAMDLSKAACKLRKNGSPTDNLTAYIYADNGSGTGPTGAILGTSANVAGSSLDAEGYTWTEFSFSTPVSLSPATIYWIIISRSGANSSSNYYWIGVDQGLHNLEGKFRIYNGSSWVARSVPCDGIFKAMGLRNTTDIIQDIYTATNQFLRELQILTPTTIQVIPFYEEMIPGVDLMEELMAVGGNNLRKLTANVTTDKRLIIKEQPEQGSNDYLVDMDGQFYTPSGNPLTPGHYPVGEWMRFKDPSEIGFTWQDPQITSSYISRVIEDVKADEIRIDH